MFTKHKITGLLFLTLQLKELQQLVPIIAEGRAVKTTIDTCKKETSTAVTQVLGVFHIMHV